MGEWDATTAAVDDALDPGIGLVFEPNRRAFPRLTAREITWLRTARLKYGPSVSLIDLSARGALFETKLQLRPGSESSLELTGRAAQTVVPFRVVWCQVSDLDLIDLQPPVDTNSDEVDFLKDSAAGWSKVIVRYTDGKLLKGYTQDFRPARLHFHIWPSMAATASEAMMVPLPLVKAIFFVRDFTGNPAHVESKAFDKLRHGRRIEVTFIDSEVIVGSTLNYQPDGDGFFVLPADARSNNMRIFVVSGCVRHVRFP